MREFIFNMTSVFVKSYEYSNSVCSIEQKEVAALNILSFYYNKFYYISFYCKVDKFFFLIFVFPHIKIWQL